MKYDWEAQISQSTMQEIDDLLPEGIHLIGLCVEDANLAEAAIIWHAEVPRAGLLMCDIFKDILGDAEEAYCEAQSTLFSSNITEH